MPSFQKTDREAELDALFEQLTQGFKDLDKIRDVEQQERQLEELTNKIKDAKGLIKEFVRDAQLDEMPAKELSQRRSGLEENLQQFNSLRRSHASKIKSRMELLQGASTPGESAADLPPQKMTTQQIVTTGRKEIQDIDTRLNRAEKVVDDTIQIGVKTAAELHKQTKQMEQVVDDLDDIEFTMKRAQKVLRDITRGLITDKFIICLLLLIAIAVIAVIVLKVFDNDDDSFPKPRELGGSEGSSQSRRLLGALHNALHNGASMGQSSLSELDKGHHQ